MILGNRATLIGNMVRAGGPDMILETPDVFPTEGVQGTTGLHDIFRGSVPGPIGYTNRPENGWLRLALETGKLPAYTDPALTPQEQSDININYRTSLTAPIMVERSRLLPRQAINLPKHNQKLYFDADGIYQGLSQQRTQWPIESALIFSGRIAMAEGESVRWRPIQGVHFRSSQLRGWARIFDFS